MGEIQGTSTSEHTDRRGWQRRTRRNIAAATLLVYGSTFLWMTSSFAGTNRPPGGAAWVIADVGALVSLALFTLAAWGVFRSKWWWERAASAIRCSDTVTMPGGERRADALIAAAPSRGWQRISAGAGAHGPREYDWARIPVRTGQKRGRGHWLLARRSVSDPAEIAYYACYGPRRSSTADLAWIAGSRWHIGYTLPEIRRLLVSLVQACSPDPEDVWCWSRWRRRRQYQARQCHYRQRGYALT